MLRPRLAPLAIAVTLLASCGPSAADRRADSLASAKAEQARLDSIENVRLVTVDSTYAPVTGVDLAKMERRPSGLYVQDTRTGTGAVADSGKWVEVRYTTWLADGQVVDSTGLKGESRKVLIGYGKIVPAWEEGLRGMRAGGRRLMVAPSSLAYGKAGRGMVPPLATLVFDVEMRRVY